MEISLLKTFLEVNRTRHFGRAAEYLCLPQSAVSARIRQLEDQLGVALFERRRNDIRLTTPGQRFLPHAEKVVGAWQAARSELTELMQADRFAVGSVPALWDPVLGPWLDATLDRYPELTIRADVNGLQALCRRLLDGELDLLLCLEAPRSDEYRVMELSTLQLRFVCSRCVDSLNAAVGTGYIVVDWGGSLAGEIADTVAVRPVLSVGMAPAALAQMLSRGGAAYLPSSMVGPLIEAGRMSEVPGISIVEKPVLGVIGRGKAALDRVTPWLQAF